MSRAIRLLIASQPPDSGVPRHVLDVVLALDRDRFSMDVACPRGSQLWDELAGEDGFRLHPIAPDRRPAPADLATLARLSPLVRQADIVHAHSSKAGFVARLAAALQRRTQRCVFTPHGWSFWAAAGAERQLYLRLERLAARWCARIATVSEHERAAGLAAGVGNAAQYHVIHNGVELARFARPPRPVPGRVLMVGRLAPPKRPDLALRALAQLLRGGTEAELCLAGDGAERREAEGLAGELGVGERVRFLGTRDDVPALLEEAACVVLASDYEACPVSLLEAAAAGVPVVATRVGGVPELVRDGVTGVLVEPGSFRALAAALASVLSDPGRARAMGAEGRRLAEQRFSRARMVAETVALYDELISAA